MGRTSKFIKNARFIVKSIQEGKGSPEFLDMFIPFSKGNCFSCGERLDVTDTLKTGSGVQYNFQCGHGIIMTDLSEVTDGGRGYSHSRIGINQDGNHSVQIKRGGSQPDKKGDEITVAKLFSHNFFPWLNSFKNDDEKSPVDIIGESKERQVTEYFQITRLSDEEFWSELNRNNQVNKVVPEITTLVEDAVIRKSKYGLKDREKIILLIDTRPGVMKEIADEICGKLSPLFKRSGFKQIWLVGVISELTHRIY